METENWQHLEIKNNDPSQWQLDGGKENVLMIALNMPGYYSLPVRILSLLTSQSEQLSSRFNVRFIENSIRKPMNVLLDVISEMAPDIIGFSNMISYDGRIRPLRDSQQIGLHPSRDPQRCGTRS